MKKLLIIFSFFLFFNASLDESNIEIELSIVDSNTFEISWSVNIQDYEELILEINHNGTTEQYQIPSSSGNIAMCCYSDEVEVTILVLVTKSIEQDSKECLAVNCYDFIKETYFNTKKLSFPTTTTTTSVTTTTLGNSSSDTTSPTFTQALTASNITNGEVDLNWSASDNVSSTARVAARQSLSSPSQPERWAT